MRSARRSRRRWVGGRPASDRSVRDGFTLSQLDINQPGTAPNCSSSSVTPRPGPSGTRPRRAGGPAARRAGRPRGNGGRGCRPGRSRCRCWARRGQVEHRGRADAQLEVAADVAGDPGRRGDLRDLDRRGDPAILAGVDADHVGRVAAQDVPGIGEGEDALIGHDRDAAVRAEVRHRLDVPRRDRLLGDQEIEPPEPLQRDPRRGDVPSAVGVDRDRDTRGRPPRERQRPGRGRLPARSRPSP